MRYTQLFNLLCDFQSTPPAWEATTSGPWFWRSAHISIHASRMEGDGSRVDFVFFISISTHASRMGGDSKSNQKRNARIGTMTKMCLPMRKKLNRSALVYLFKVAKMRLFRCERPGCLMMTCGSRL